MDTNALYEEAMESLNRLGVEVRQEHLGGEGGGCCTIKGRRVVFVDLDAGVRRRLECCVERLRGLAEVEAMYLSPALRNLIEGIEAESDQTSKG